MLRVRAYCLAEFAGITAQAVGGERLTAPPLHASVIAPALFEGYGFLYFDMHGHPNTPYWDDGHGMPTLYAQTIRDSNLNGVIAFTTACNAGDDQSPMLDALLAAGCRYVVAGSGANYTTSRISGAASLARLFLRNLNRQISAPVALKLAKNMYRRLSRDPEQVKADTLQFMIFEKG